MADEALEEVLLSDASRAARLANSYAPRFETRCRRWAMLALVCFAACLACGPVTSFPTFEPMLCKLGVLGSTHNATSDTSQT